ncbi:MAG: carbonic anhydrase [Hyphomonadaceae bacterium]
MEQRAQAASPEKLALGGAGRLKAPMQHLIDGYRIYRAKRWPELQQLHKELAERGQSPKTLVIACADSRVDPATIFNARPGELLVLRNVANLAPPYETDRGFHGVSAGIEFAVKALKVQTILVLGHAQCGGVAAALEPRERDPNSFLDMWIGLLDKAKSRVHGHDDAARTALEYESIRVTLDNLTTFPFVAEAIAERGLALVGMRYGVADGGLELLDPEDGAFKPVV